jgi:hypothetical protein
MSIMLVCTIIKKVAMVTLLCGFWPYGIMIIGLYVSVYTIAMVILLGDSQPYDLHYWKFISSFKG